MLLYVCMHTSTYNTSDIKQSVTVLLITVIVATAKQISFHALTDDIIQYNNTISHNALLGNCSYRELLQNQLISLLLSLLLEKLYPSCLQTTPAFIIPQWLSHTEPYELLRQTSTRPLALLPFINLTSPSLQTDIKNMASGYTVLH